MSEIKSWCFLCASDKNVNVEISFLDECLRELIGTFSIINFSLVSSHICVDCDGFLKEHERRKALYGRVESMYMEILKMRNKPAIDVCAIRAKHQIDSEAPAQFKIPPKDHQSLVDIFEFEIHEVENKELMQTDEVPEQAVDQIEVRRVSKRTPKILNPTLIQLPRVQARQKFECDLCNYLSSTKALLSKHVDSVHKKLSETSFKCASCSKICTSKDGLQLHIKRHHEDKLKINCPECMKPLSSQSSLACHIRTVHKQRKDFQCSSCPKTFATKGTCKEHEKTHLTVKSLACPMCSKTFKTSSALTHHIDTHETSEYSCPECGKCLNSKRTLKMHLVTHSSVTKFDCPFCQSQFKRVKDYKEHLMAMHTDLKPYSCDWCAKTFSNGPNCRKHKRENHPAELKEAEKSQEKKKIQLPTIDELIEIIAMKTER